MKAKDLAAVLELFSPEGQRKLQEIHDQMVAYEQAAKAHEEREQVVAQHEMSAAEREQAVSEREAAAAKVERDLEARARELGEGLAALKEREDAHAGRVDEHTANILEVSKRLGDDRATLEKAEADFGAWAQEQRIELQHEREMLEADKAAWEAERDRRAKKLAMYQEAESI